MVGRVTKLVGQQEHGHGADISKAQTCSWSTSWDMEVLVKTCRAEMHRHPKSGPPLIPISGALQTLFRERARELVSRLNRFYGRRNYSDGDSGLRLNLTVWCQLFQLFRSLCKRSSLMEWHFAVWCRKGYQSENMFCIKKSIKQFNFETEILVCGYFIDEDGDKNDCENQELWDRSRECLILVATKT